MATLEQAKQIDTAISGWTTMTPIEQARAVLQWCTENGIGTKLKDAQLSEAMQEFPYWAGGPVNYLDFILAFGRVVK